MKAFTQKSDEFDQLNPLRTTAHQSTILRTLRLLLCRTACALLALTTMSLATSVYAQNCNALVPGGGDDAVQINNCLATVGHATLTANTFLINQPIAWPQVSNVSLTGAGKNATHIVPQYSCGQSSAFVVNGTFQNIIWVLKAPSATLRDFHLDLSNLRQSCGNAPNMAVRIDKSPSSQVRSLKISGSQYGDPGYTSGWANGGGINVVNSANCVIDNNAIRELGFIDGAFEGLRIEASGSTLVNSNVVFHVSFALVISNGTVAQGYTGDSSFSTITSNIFTGAAGINCPGCHSGRSIKMIACAFDPIPPMRYLTVTNNTGSNWGGPDQAGVSPSGIDLHCGVQYSTFTGNNFVGGPQSSYGLEIRSSFMSNQVASHHNVFNNNTFAAGPCSGCFDVFFTGDGPDQSSGTISSVPSIGRAVHGSNSFSTSSSPQDRGCSQFAHAFWDYPAGQTFINRGQLLSVAAAGLRPDFSPIAFIFKDPNGNVVLTSIFSGAGSNCVMNQQLVLIDPSKFLSPGLYKVYATYKDGNSDAQIVEDWIGTGGQQTTLDVR